MNIITEEKIVEAAIMVTVLFIILFQAYFNYQWFWTNLQSHTAYAHIFISNDNASSFLTLLERVRVESLLINDSMHSNLTSAEEHEAQLLDRIDDITDSENENTIRTVEFDNSTVKALLFANILDEVLRYYGGAYGILPPIMLNMSSMASGAEMNLNHQSLSIINQEKYKTAYEYAKRALELFYVKLRTPETKQTTNPAAPAQIEKGLGQLINAIENKANPMEIKMIVHTKIHPNLQVAYNLKLMK
jgi:hypothetical protein